MPTSDFPFYNGRPVRLAAAQWWLIVIGVVLGFAVLVTPVPLFRDSLGQLVPAVLFAAIPLGAYALATPEHWTVVFRRVSGRSVLWMVSIAMLNIAVTFAVGWVVMRLHGAASNPAFELIAGQGGLDRTWFFLRTLPQLFGEEVITILPMLGLMTLFHGVLRLSRTTAVLLAWLLSSLMFGALHLPTYAWNVVQSLAVIGAARLVLTVAYLKTKNLWVSTGAHIINDWTLFAIGLSLMSFDKPRF